MPCDGPVTSIALLVYFAGETLGPYSHAIALFKHGKDIFVLE